MKNLPTYNQFVNEDSDNSEELKKPHFTRSYIMDPNWWNSWKKENKDKSYLIIKDSEAEIYQVSENGKMLFEYDYVRFKIFTNESPTLFKVKKESVV